MGRYRQIGLAALLIVALAGTATVFAQRNYERRESAYTQSYSGNVRYDGRFVFVRMSYPFSGRQQPYWAHDYPTGEEHFLKILSSITNLSTHVTESSIMSFSDPEMFKFPVLYLCEPGYWYMSDGDVTNLRAYFLKGGFLVVDDFPFRAWAQFDQQMARVFPEGRWIELDPTHPIFHSFFEINSFDIIPQAYNLGGRPIFLAMFEDNDPAKRMYAMVNYQNDISEFWEYSETGRYLVSDANEAYKIGVNQFIYGITH